jgi:hypothetical protein
MARRCRRCCFEGVVGSLAPVQPGPATISEALIMLFHLPKLKQDFDVRKAAVYPIQTREARELVAEIRG